MGGDLNICGAILKGIHVFSSLDTIFYRRSVV